MIIPLKNLEIRTFYRALLSLLSKFPPIRGLRERELDVLAELMVSNYKFRDVQNYNRRQVLVHTTKNRKEMRENLKMPSGNFNDYLARIRKKGLLSKDNKMLPFLDIIPDDKFDLNFKFTIKEE